MTYNLHPIFVHFPIALLLIYSFIKILPFQKWFPKVSWKQIERAFLFFGVLGAFAALATGETAEHLVKPNRQLVEAHSTFAALSTWMYAALLIGEIASLLVIKYANPFLGFLKRFLADSLFSRIVALFALVSISLTGLLGGVIVYGTTADPFAGMILKILGITL